MIEIIGSNSGPEYEAAKYLYKLIEMAWPKVTENNRDEVWIIAGAKCYGQEVVDIDILLFIQMTTMYPISLPFPKQKSVYIDSLCVCIELKSHSREGVRFIGNRVEVKYKDKWHNVSEQSFKQKYSVRNYISEHISPFVVNLIWLQNVLESELPPPVHNIVGSDATWETFLRRISENQEVRLNQNTGTFEIHAFRQQKSGLLKAAAETFIRKMQPSSLDRQRMERISKKLVLDQKYADKLGKQLLVFRGRGGTGKTARLLQLAYNLYIEEDARILLLTYNKALVSDIRRTLDHKGVSRKIATSSVNIQTVHSFLRQILVGLGICSSLDKNFLTNYDKYKQTALELIRPRDIEDLIQSNNQAFSWDFIFIDESQDWPIDERDILFSVYNYQQFVIADGIDQLIRSHKPINWRENIPREENTNRTLKQVLRLKSNLARFVNTFAHHIGLESWEAQPHEQAVGGRIIIVEGLYAKERNIHDEIIQKNKDDGNEPVDMLFCVPPKLVDSKGDFRYSVVGKKFENWGFKIWDGVAPDIREDYPTELNQLRIVQYDSCRGLEGWIGVNFEFDDFYDYKIATFEPTIEESMDMFFDETKAARDYAAQWLMIPLTRAMDTLVIQVSSSNHFVTQALRATAEEWKDFVDWRKVE